MKNIFNTPHTKIYQAVGNAINRCNNEADQMRWCQSNFAILRPGSKIHTIDGTFIARKYGLFEKEGSTMRYQFDTVFKAVKKSLESE